MTLPEIDAKIAQAKGDVIFWTRRVARRHTDYDRSQLYNAKQKVERWEREKLFYKAPM